MVPPLLLSLSLSTSPKFHISFHHHHQIKNKKITKVKNRQFTRETLNRHFTSFAYCVMRIALLLFYFCRNIVGLMHYFFSLFFNSYRVGFLRFVHHTHNKYLESTPFFLFLFFILLFFHFVTLPFP